MGWILTIIIGGVLGWLASKVMKTDAAMDGTCSSTSFE